MVGSYLSAPAGKDGLFPTPQMAPSEVEGVCCGSWPRVPPLSLVELDLSPGPCSQASIHVSIINKSEIVG